MELLAERYELRDVIGRGGTAVVHRAWDRVLEREVAVKVLLAPEALEEPEAARLRFAAEAKLLARLDHPALVTLLDAGTSEGRPFFVLELVDGGTVVDMLAAAPLDPVVVADIGAQLADALDHAHAHGIVHRDVKPGNVLVTPDGRVKLADFGIARLLGEVVGVTRTGHTVGTIAYLAPEQVRGERVGAAADIYALGLLLLEALTGVRAYPGTSTESAVARLHHGPTIPLSLPTGWPRLLAAMTAADPAERPTAETAATALRHLAAGGPVPGPAGADLPRTVSTASGGPATRAVPLAPTRRRTAVRWAGVATAVVVGAAVGIGTLGPNPAVSEDEPAATRRVQPATVLSPSPAPADGTGTPSGRATPQARGDRPATPSRPGASGSGPQGKAHGHRGHPGKDKSKGKNKGKNKHAAGAHGGPGGPGGKGGGKPGRGKGR
ncbi:protein kinase [Nocardioides sp. zg-579]|uniref:non-specific serine/threonine protein kinase n=1 Tax=Nocardioides marmotae TaxID=2663857 RepID=A0A6I3JG53_9ACTN|nr:serine/threonine-protein kinase [Nocardioides marmotae]MCR6033261.1 protein kinase [Gordonia jinghuaiqii]MTB96918.1 protein kinase [Nocardioides marmotae]QKE00694.1 protein kinase [Nocardioides marmotae]